MSQGETRLVYDGLVPIQERTSSSNPTVTYTRGTDLSGTFEGAGGIGGLLARSAHAGSTPFQPNSHAFYHADGNGNVTYLTRADGSAVGVYKCDPFGRTLATSGTLASANRMRFSSKPWVQSASGSSGYYAYGYRFYDPTSQRWLNRDPLGDYAFFRRVAQGKTWAEKQRLRSEAIGNLYGFVRNKPMNVVDLDGMIGWQFTDPFGRPLPQPNYSTDMPCAREILDTYRMFLGNSGFDSYPTANDDDRLQHCITSCKLARACGTAVAWALGSLKESRDLLFGGSAEETAGDMGANEAGLGGVHCKQQSCEDYCANIRDQY
jgi:RHS repeat-associated protein